MKLRIIHFHRRDLLIHDHFRIHLFFQLALQGLFGSLTRFDLSARKFPAIPELSVPALCCQNLTSFPDDCSRNPDGLHDFAYFFRRAVS